MKTLLYILISIFLGCENPQEKPHPTTISDTATEVSNRKVDISLYTQKDTIVITTESFDTLKYSKQEFNEIVDNFPELYNDIADNPDVSYYRSGIFKDILDANGNKKHLTFGGEVGQDKYYLLYAYFLKKNNGNKKFEVRRKILINIYSNINSIFGTLNYGGTYFGHQYQRIAGYAEHSIYWYSQREDFFIKSYDISSQKKLYLNSLRQFINDEESVDNNTIDKKEKADRKRELFQLVTSLDSLITDNFYLKRAQEYQYSNY